MKQIFKNPTLYYVLVPILGILWPLMIWAVYLPGSDQSWNDEKIQYEKAQKKMREILKIDPERLEMADAKGGAAEFDYAVAVDNAARKMGISDENYKLSTGIPINSGGQRSQSAQVTLKKVSVKKFAEFISTIQLRWGNLQCTNIKLTKKKGFADAWDIDLKFKYFF